MAFVSGLESLPMRITSRSWTPAQIERLRQLIEAGATDYRASAALNRTRTSVRMQAKILGLIFRKMRDRPRAEGRMRISAE